MERPFFVCSAEDEAFTIDKLAELIRETVGLFGLWVFGLGFIAAALSSMLTVPLGAAITADSMFTIPRKDEEGKSICFFQTVSAKLNNKIG